MKNLFLLMLCFNVYCTSAQMVNEVEKPQHIKGSYDLFYKLDTSIEQNISMLTSSLADNPNEFQKNLIYQYLSYFYTANNQPEKCLSLLDSLNKTGLIMPYTISDQPEPEFLALYREDNRFLEFIKKNDFLKREASKNGKLEYFVELPVNYDSTKSYPLVILFHGGHGSYYDTYIHWESRVLKEQFITVYTQGSKVIDSYMRRYGEDFQIEVAELYDQLIRKYSVNTSKVFLAGQSRGGHMSIQLSYETIPTKGMFLAFPVKPIDFTYQKAMQFSENDMRVVMICGKRDKAFMEGQLEIAKLIDSAQVKKHTIFYPEIGHEFPDNFSEQLDKGLEFLVK